MLILLHEKFLQFDWLRAVVFQLNLKYLHVKITVSHVAVGERGLKVNSVHQVDCTVVLYLI